MCGIAGYISWNNKFSTEDIIAMTNALHRRGPNAEGFYTDAVASLGHRRLSILDLSESANQPMHSNCGRYVIVYNGEVKNFKEIQEELLLGNKQLKFKTTSDTEVIIEAFVHWGISFINKLNGMFAFAIYDKLNQELFIARDRMGIKPLYFYKDDNNFVFASELKAFKVLKHKIDFALNYTAINEFLHLGYIPQPHSIYNSISKFPTGSYLVLSQRKYEFTNYWNLSDKIENNCITSFSEAKDKLKELVESSVKYRMISDVPFGTFLSGGIDSSLVTAVAQKHADKPVNTFSIGFTDKKHNEAGYAKAIATYLKTNHHEFTVTEKDALEIIPSLVTIYDEPYADSSAVPTLLVSKMARNHVTMTLAGDGGDELFMGYGAYTWAKRLANPITPYVKNAVASVFSKLDSRYKRIGKLVDYKNKETLGSHIFSQEQYLFSRKEIKQLLKTDIYREIQLQENFTGLKRKLTAAEQQALFDLNYYLKDDLLVKVDRATMYHSLETRVPLLDYRIVEFALNLSPEMKIHQGINKFLLKEVLFDYIPKHFFERPKWGFSIPLQKWLKNELKEWKDSYLNEQIINKYNIVKYNQVKDLKDKFDSGKYDYLYNRIWLLTILHYWLEEN